MDEHDLTRRLDRIERQQAEMLQLLRRALKLDGVPAAAAKRKIIDGQPHIWGGEGTGWVREHVSASRKGAVR